MSTINHRNELGYKYIYHAKKQILMHQKREEVAEETLRGSTRHTVKMKSVNASFHSLSPLS